MKQLTIAAVLLLQFTSVAFAQTTTNNPTEARDRLLSRFLRYVSIDSHSEERDTFFVSEGQKQMARLVYQELSDIPGVEAILDTDYYYVYAVLPGDTSLPSVGFHSHLDITPEAPTTGITPRVHYHYGGGCIELGDGIVLDPRTPQGRGLEAQIGRTIVTSSGNTLLGGDCKAGVSIIVGLLEELCSSSERRPAVWAILSQNEEIGTSAEHMRVGVLDKVDIFYDLDGDVEGEIAVANYTALNSTVTFEGNLAHTSNAEGFADARYALAYFLTALSPEIHPSRRTTGRCGYVHCYTTRQFENKHDFSAGLRIRYFDESEGREFTRIIDEALAKTREAFPLVNIKQETFLQYDNVAPHMHPQAVPVVMSAAKNMGISLEPVWLRAGTTSALMAVRGLKGGPCLFSGQHAVHSVYEWVSIEEMLEVKRLLNEIVNRVASM